MSIWRDYAIEISVLMLGVWAAKASKVGMGGVQEFCALAALTLIVDACALWGFYTGVLTIMVEVRLSPFSISYLML
jgi:hydroxymethylglutaryl-CoA reductase (NADPH)